MTKAITCTVIGRLIQEGWLASVEALDSGCDAYISKPISMLGLLYTVESFLSRFPTRAPPGFVDLRSPANK